MTRQIACFALVSLLVVGAVGCGRDWQDICSRIQTKADSCSAELGKTVNVNTCDPALLDSCDNQDDVGDAIEPCLEVDDCQAFDECYPFSLFCVQKP